MLRHDGLVVNEAALQNMENISGRNVTLSQTLARMRLVVQSQVIAFGTCVDAFRCIAGFPSLRRLHLQLPITVIHGDQ